MDASNKNKSATADAKVLPDHPGRLLRRALQRCREIHTSVCAHLDITSMQATALYALGIIGPTTQAALGIAIDMEPSNVHGLIRRLIAKKLITLTVHKTDARANIITLTPEGKRFANELEKLSVDISEQFLAPLNTKEQKTLQSLLLRVIEA